MSSPTPLTYAFPASRPSPYRPIAYLITYLPPVLICFIAVLMAAVYLSPLGRICPSDAVALPAPWVEREATYGAWVNDPPSEGGPPKPGIHRSGTIDIQFYTFTFIEYAEADADLTYHKPYYIRIMDVQTHYLWLIPAALAWTVILFAVAWVWQRGCRTLFTRWLKLMA